MSWQIRLLEDCATFLSGGTPSKKRSDYWDGAIPWVSSAELTDRFIDDTKLHITADGLQSGSRLAPAGTIFAVVRGMSLATEFRISLSLRPMAFNQDVKAIMPKPGIDGTFLFYALSGRANEIRDLATEAAHGTKKLEMNRLAGLPISVPDLETQCKVANIGFAYDDLITANQRRIQLLEESARLLYREWFVKLRFPGHETVPVSDGVPGGWEHGTVYDFVSILSGGTPKTGYEHYWGGDIPFFTPKDYPGTFYVTGTEKMLTESGLENCNSRFFPKDTIFVTARGTVGKTTLAQRPMAMNQSCYALVPKEEFDNLFLFLAMRDAVEHFIQVASCGVFSALVVDTFKAVPFLKPPRELAKSFGQLVRPIFDQIETLILQNSSLQEARDLLLPKLMSGALDVSRITVPQEVAA